ncbi:MAG: isoleucine--tRNA ligase [Candidatus Omnitrophota bacterium]|jgi:isoleucyl-tRNA synthetase
MEYKNTLNLPKTDFPMKGNLPDKEPVILEKWEKAGLYKAIREKRKASPKYILHDGPPYANGNIHIGHALNKTLKDIVIKFKTMQGFDSPYVPGWDCHGMPIEHQLFKELKKTKHDVDQVKFRKMAHEFAMKFVDIQKAEFERLGVFGDWDNPYLTLKPEYEKAVTASFNKLAQDGLIYRGLKPINWCARCETALAEAEVEYEDHTSPSIYVKFDVVGDGRDRPLQSFLVWTTTPWTLVSNVAIAVHPDLAYVYVDAEQYGTLLLAQDLLEATLKKLGVKGAIKKTVRGRELEGMTAMHPFLDRSSKVVTADYVSNEDGTGCVHIAPGHGQEDYEVGLRYNLPVVMPVDEKGRFRKIETFEVPDELIGKNIQEANDIVLKMLSDRKAILVSEKTEHSYPYCWRCHSPLLFRATKQWFLGVDRNNLRQKTLDEIKKVKWVPEAGEKRISSMIGSRPDWCLSRQRYWGVPVPILYCVSCNSEIIDAGVMKKIEETFGASGSDSWFIKDAKSFTPEGFKCKKCGGAEFKKETDILDVWFESGASHQGVLRINKGLAFPADLYLEGSDQHRGWFQSSILVGIGVEGRTPFKNVLTHGFVMDGEGKKMSKSAGNVVSPQEVISKKGADVLRLWASSSSYFDDVRISEEILDRTVEAYRKFRNTAKYLLGNLYDFDPAKDSIAGKDLLEIDRWALSRLNSMLKEVTDSFERFMFHEVTASSYKFCIIDMSNFYLDILKDRLYTFGAGSKARRSGQTVLYKILNVLTRIMAPIIPFTCEEIWGHFNKTGSVHLADWPKAESGLIDPELEARWRKLMLLREDVLKVLEEKRSAKLIGGSLEARVTLTAAGEEHEFLKSYLDSLRYIFIVSQVTLVKGENKDIRVDRAEGEKCSRCWNWSALVGEDKSNPTLCERCVSVVTEGRIE